MYTFSSNKILCFNPFLFSFGPLPFLGSVKLPADCGVTPCGEWQYTRMALTEGQQLQTGLKTFARTHKMFTNLETLFLQYKLIEKSLFGMCDAPTLSLRDHSDLKIHPSIQVGPCASCHSYH